MRSLPSAPELDQLTITIVVDNATDTLSSVAPGIPQLPEMAYLLGSIPPSGQHDGHNCVVTFDHLCVACHGFSALATARQGDHTATVLFDVGPYGDVWLANAERLAVDLSTIGALVLSHWHWDHSGGITTVVAAIAAARDRAGRTPLIVDVHPDRPDKRGILTPFDVFAMLPPEPTLEAIETAGGNVVTHADVHVVAELFLTSGDIPRKTSYETGLPGHHSWRGDQVPSIRRSTTSASSPPTCAAEERQCSPPAPTPASSTSALKPDGCFPINPSTSSSAATTSPAQPSKTASDPPCATSPTSSHPGSLRQDTAPAGAPRPRSPTHSAPLTAHQALSARATCSTPPSADNKIHGQARSDAGTASASATSARTRSALMAIAAADPARAAVIT